MIRTGLDVLLADLTPIKGRKVGLVTNQSAVTGNLRHGAIALHESSECDLVRLFGPEHGIWGEAQDMDHVDSALDPATGLPVHSLYGRTKEDLTPPMDLLMDLDVLVIDLQDVGSRYYTFIYTMALCMQVAGHVGVPVVVLDRPNPINGVQVEGNLHEPGFHSFVGMFPLPVRHALTIGELARYFNVRFTLHCDVTVIPMQGWQRSMFWDETGLPWVIPSPNMPTPLTAIVYPGMCLIEGTNLSEGRGTTKPFELFGAPWLDSFALAARLNSVDLPGVRFRPHSFKPTNQKHAGEICGGVQLHVTDRHTFEPYRTGLWCVKIARELDEHNFDWRREPYEYENETLAIDLLCGTDLFRAMVESDREIDLWVGQWETEQSVFLDERRNYLLY